MKAVNLDRSFSIGFEIRLWNPKQLHIRSKFCNTTYNLLIKFWGKSITLFISAVIYDVKLSIHCISPGEWCGETWFMIWTTLSTNFHWIWPPKIRISEWQRIEKFSQFWLTLWASIFFLQYSKRTALVNTPGISSFGHCMTLKLVPAIPLVK